jgi:hypothetical protein
VSDRSQVSSSKVGVIERERVCVCMCVCVCVCEREREREEKVVNKCGRFYEVEKILNDF